MKKKLITFKEFMTEKKIDDIILIYIKKHKKLLDKLNLV